MGAGYCGGTGRDQGINRAAMEVAYTWGVGGYMGSL